MMLPPPRPGDELKATRAEWERLRKHVQKGLRPLYPYDDVDNPTFGRASDEWASTLLEVAAAEVSTWFWQDHRLTKEQLGHKEQVPYSNLEKARVSDMMSYDLVNLVGCGVDVLYR